MKTIISLFFCVMQLILFGQKTIEIKDKKKNEIYNVLEQDKSIKHGLYTELGSNKCPKTIGYYKYGKQDSVWTYYSWDCSSIYQKGSFTEGIQSGIWEYYHRNNQLEQSYNYTTKELIFTSEQIAENNRPAVYIGGKAELQKYISMNMMYPQSAIEANISGKVILQLTIDKSGEITETKIIQSVSNDCDNEAIRILKGTKNKWVPAIKNAEAVDCIMQIPVAFNLN